jgi:hypothetical protein
MGKQKLSLFYKNVEPEGIEIIWNWATKKEKSLYIKLFELRQTGDYNDWIIIESAYMETLAEPAEKFIDTIENLIFQTNK